MAETTVLDDPTLQISAFSRPLHLGMLYDARKDQLIPGISLWNVQDISDKTKITPQPNTRFQVAMSESLCEKTKLLDLSASVRASFLCGLVQLEGSATYLREKTSSVHECRASLRYHVTTEVRELMISELGPPSPGVFDKTDATHVVIQALYGADSLMEFQQTASDESEKQDIEGNLNVMINKIPSIEISGDGSVKMDDEDKEKVKNFSCTFFGDVDVTELPSTFEEAVKVYKELPSLLGEKQEKAVPVTVWLYPLSNFTSVESKFKTMISESLVSTVEEVMDDLHQAEIKTHDLLEKSKVIKAEDITIKLKQFQTSLLAYTTEFVHKMAGLVPAIREGTMEESSLTDLLKSQDASGFSQKDMWQWLDGKETEINTLTMYIKKLPDCQIKSEGSELETFLMDPDVTDAFVFSFTSLKYEEAYLDKISKVTEDLKTGPITPAQMPTDEVPWYKTPGVKEALDSALSVFRNVTSQKKAISFISDPKYLGASVQWYQNAVLKDPHVEMQSPPLQAYGCYLTLDPNTAGPHLLLSEGNRRVTCVEETQPYPDLPERFTGSEVLCAEPLSDRCYWECELGGALIVGIGVAYQSISRKGSWSDVELGRNEKSWSVLHSNSKDIHLRYCALHNNEITELQYLPPGCRRVGLYLDRKGGTLSFYIVSSGILTLWHTFNASFTDEPLYAGMMVAKDTFVSLI